VDWAGGWKASTASLFELWQRCESMGSEHCIPLLEQIRDSRALAEAAPEPEIRALAMRLLDEAWDAARSLLYGDLEHARERLAETRRLDREIHSRIHELPQDEEA
jgi:hypothetical protein